MNTTRFDLIMEMTLQEFRAQKAKAYATKARERNKQSCQCNACRMAETLPAVQRIVENWRKP